MQILAPLVAGIVGASNGSVRIRRRGQATLATYYTDFEGSNAVTPPGAVALDSNGRLIAYVFEPVDCTVYDSLGQTVTSFTYGDSSAAVEVISQSFTGTDYGTGASGASLPVELQVVLDRWLTNAGAIDWKVLVNGAPATLKNAVSGVVGLYFNVKDNAFGAVGDGVANDTSAIAAAFTAAALTGGTVYFPAGTYRVTATLTLPGNVNMLGAGSAASLIRVDDGTGLTVALTISNATTIGWQSIRGLRFGNNQASTATALVNVTAAALVRIDECAIGDANTKTCLSVSHASAKLFLSATTFVFGNAAGKWVNGTAANRLVGASCRFVPPASFTGQGLDSTGGVVLFGCVFENGTATVGTYTCIRPSGGLGGGNALPSIIAGCDFQATGGATVTCIAGAAGMTNLCEVGNYFDATVTPYGTMSAPADISTDGVMLLSRPFREEMQTTDAAAATANADKFGLTKIKRGAGFATAQTLTIATPKGPGHSFTLVYHNTNAGGVTGAVTIAGNVKGLASFTVNASVCSVYHFKSVEVNLANSWILVGSQVNFAP